MRSALTDKDVVLRSVPVNLAPEGALQETRAVVGKVAMTDLVPGEVILQQRLADPNVTAHDGRAALMMAGDEVLMAFPAADLLSKAGVLKAGDHIDLLFSLQVPTNRGLAGVRAGGGGSEEELTAFNVLPNVTISALVAGKALKEGEEIGAADCVSVSAQPPGRAGAQICEGRGRHVGYGAPRAGAEQPAEADPVDVDYVIKRYKLPTEVGR